MNNITDIIKLEAPYVADIESIAKAFGAPFEEAGVVLEMYKELEVTNVSQTDKMQAAREARLVLKKTRSIIEKNRVILKSDSLKQGTGIDTIAKYIKSQIEPAEEFLQLQEDFIKIGTEAQAAKIKAERIEKLSIYANDLSLYNLDHMSDDQFDNLVAGLKAQNKADNEAKALEEKERLQALADEVKRQKERDAENEKLKKEAAAKQLEDEKAEAERAEERKIEQDKQDKLLAKANEVIKIEREKREALEAETHRIVAENNAKEAENDARIELETKERQEKEMAELLAPDKEKLTTFARAIDTIRKTKLPAVKNKQAQDVVNQIDSDLEEIYIMIVNKAKDL